MPADPPSPLDSLLLFLEYGGELTVNGFVEYDDPDGEILYRVAASCANPFTDEPAHRMDVVPFPQGGNPVPPAAEVFAFACKVAAEAADAAEIAAWEEAAGGVAGEIDDDDDPEGSDETDDGEEERWTVTEDDEDDGDDFRPEGKADEETTADAPPGHADESLADLSAEMAEWTDRPREEARRSPGQGESDTAATHYDFLKAAGRISIRIGTTPEELFFPYLSVVASGKPLGEGERRAAVIDPAQLRGSDDPAAELMAVMTRAISVEKAESVNRAHGVRRLHSGMFRVSSGWPATGRCNT